MFCVQGVIYKLFISFQDEGYQIFVVFSSFQTFSCSKYWIICFWCLNHVQWNKLWIVHLKRVEAASRFFSMKKAILIYFAKFTRKQLCESLFFIKLQPLVCNSFEKRLWHRWFPVNFAKFLKPSFLRNTYGRLLLRGLFKENFRQRPC